MTDELKPLGEEPKPEAEKLAKKPGERSKPAGETDMSEFTGGKADDKK